MVAANRNTSGGTRGVDRTISAQLIRTVPAIPAYQADVDNITNQRARNQTNPNATRHANNLAATGLPVDYEHDQAIGKQHLKAALFRRYLADDPWSRVRAHES